MTVESIELAPGYRMPRLIRGGWLWRIQNGEVTTSGQLSMEDVQGVQARLPK